MGDELTFLKKAMQSIVWVGTILRHLFQLLPALSGMVVFYALFGRLTRILAFILPLKVILLAGSDGVPSYFRAYIAADAKPLAVLILASLAIACYFTTLGCEAINRRIADKGGDALMASSVGLSVISNQRGELKAYYSRFTYLSAIALFVLVGMGAMVAIHPPLATVLALFPLFSLVVTASILRDRADHKRGRLASYIVDNSSNYVGILSSLTFLCGFLAILYPLLGGNHPDIPHSLIAVVLLRQLLGGASTVVKEIVSLSQSRRIVDALIFPEHRLHKLDHSEQGGLQQLFEKARREEKFAAELPGVVGSNCTVDMRWEDSGVRGAHNFLATVRGTGISAPRNFHQHVYHSRITRPLENEALLFDHIRRDDVFAPPLLGRYTYGSFECAVYDAGTGKTPPLSALKPIQKAFQFRLAALQPPKALLEAFKSSHPLPAEQLNDKSLARLEIAVDDHADRETLARFRQHLPEVQAQLGLVPLCVANPDFRLANLTATDDGFRMMSWGQWTMEPLGAGASGDLEAMRELLDHARAGRSDIPSSLTPEHLVFVAECTRLETAITRGNFRAALGLLDGVLSRMWATESTGPQRLSA